MSESLYSSRPLPNPVFSPDIDLTKYITGISLNRKRGMVSEALVAKALLLLKEKSYGLGYRIKGFIRTVPNSLLDRNQIDFVVNVQDDLDIMLQVKNSESQRRKCEKRMERLGKLVVAIAVKAYENLNSVLRKVVRGIKLAVNKAKRRLNDKIHADRRRIKPGWQERCLRFHSPRMCH